MKDGSNLKAFFWYFVSAFTLKGIVMLTTPLFTRLLSTADYGIVATYNMWFNTLIVICSLNLSAGIGRAKCDFKDNFSSYIYSLQYLALVTTLGITVVFLLLHKYFLPIMGIDIYTIFLLFVALLFTPIVTFQQIKYKYEYNYKGNVAISVFTAIGTIVFSVLFIVMFDSKRYLGRILGIAFPSILLSCFFWIKSIINKESHIIFYAWRYASKISIPLMAHTLSQRILAQSDQAMITFYCGTSYTGIYSLAVQIAMLFTLIEESMEQAWRPWFYDNLEGNENEISNIMIKMVSLGCYIVLMIVIIAPEVMNIFGTSEYRDGIYILPLLILGGICQHISKHYIAVELYFHKSTNISICTIIVTICNLLLNKRYIPQYGYIAAAWTTLFCYFFLVILHMGVVKFIIKKNIYKNKLTIGYLFVTGLLMIIIVSFYESLVNRIAIGILLTMLTIYCNKNYIGNIIKLMRMKNETRD